MAFKNKLNNTTEYTLSYSNMRGVDFSTGNPESKKHRFPYLENMYRDYESGNMNVLESFPGFRRITRLKEKVHSFFCQKDSDGIRHMLVHAGTSLYRFPLDSRDELLSWLKPIATLSDNRSRGFCWGCDVYILDGYSITKISDDGTAETVDDYNAKPYIPLTYKNGIEIEQRNLLTKKFTESFALLSADDYTYATEGLKYKIISTADKTASVSGFSSETETVVYIPSYVTLSGEKYAVTAIDDNAFIDNSLITQVYMSAKQTRIGKKAFYGCSSLKKVITSDFIEEIGDNAFASCPLLVTLFLGVGLKRLGNDVLVGSNTILEIEYGGAVSDFSKIENNSQFNSLVVRGKKSYNDIKIAIPVFSPAIFINSVKMDDKAIDYTVKTGNNGFIDEIILQPADKYGMDGKNVTIVGELHDYRLSKASTENDILLSANYDTVEAIKHCTVCETFDGRVFLSGNPDFPNTVFYSGRDRNGKSNPLYFGALNFFNDGTGSYAVKSMLTTSEGLVVFKEGDDGGGSIYYHTPQETGIDLLPKIYPVSYVHSGTTAIGESISFFDDPIFISELGICGLEKKNLNLERSVKTRSHNINPHLFSNDLSKTSLSRWCGYLVVCSGKNFYLADSRDTFRHPSGSIEYEWYYLNNIGTYEEDRRVYRYSAVSDYYEIYKEPDAIVTGAVFAEQIGEDIGYYTLVNGVRCSIYPTEERYMGKLSPACCVFSTSDDILFFGTESGDICVFNNDKRGVAPDRIRNSESFNSEEYEKEYGNRIHSDFYSFADHAPTYTVSFPKDDCSIPNLTKSTVKNSLSVKLRAFGTANITCQVGTDRSGHKEYAVIPDSGLNFNDLDFSSLSFSNNDFVTFPLCEKEKGWIEKQLSFFSHSYREPFGICSATYRFTVKGRIKPQ